jgi:Fe-S oxidoreductase
MALADYRPDMERCSRCSYCKFVPQAKIKSLRFAQGCPSIAKYNFHSYSGGGKLAAALSLITGRIELVDVIYRCQMCGSCDVACKVCTRLEPYEILLELRSRAVEEGQVLPAHMHIFESLKNNDNTLDKPKADRGKWAEGLSVKDITKEKAEVIYHAGCRYSFDEELWPVARAAVTVLQKAGVDVGIMGKEETCCGGRVYELGYKGEFIPYAEHNIETWNKAGVKTVVMSCADGYGAIKYYYPRLKKEMKFEVVHITQYLERLIKEGKLKLKNEVPMEVTYHDPCHLGRLGETFILWEGVRAKILGQYNIKIPARILNRGAKGIYDSPRNVIKSIPGLKLTEMERIREYAWCCGAGSGVREAFPDFAEWTALERIYEAKTTTGAEAIVTACPWCERNFKDAIKLNGDRIKVYDIIELVEQAI